MPKLYPQMHRAWWIAAITFSTLISAAAFRSTTGVMLEPLEAEFGWSRSTTAGAVSLNLLFYGLTAPFAATLIERFAMRRVVVLALSLVAVGSSLTIAISQPWHLYLLWGVFIGFGTGCLALVFGNAVANRWFSKNRGLVTGIFSAAYATGSLVFLPLFGLIVDSGGWRNISLIIGGLSAAIVPIVVLFFRDRPSDLGLYAYGSSSEIEMGPVAPLTAFGAIIVLREATRSRAFWVLAGTFFVCGWSTNGLIGTHFIPAAHDHGMKTTTATSLLAVVGIFDLLGTIASGWLTDRVNSIYLLVAYYGLRGLALLSVPTVLGPEVKPPLLFFIVFYGLDWIATVPPTIQLCRNLFGLSKSGVVYGWVFASHMIGAAIAAAFAGWIRDVNGSYSIAWYTAAVLCLIAASCMFLIKGVKLAVSQEKTLI